uniref:Uncharacterized protein n=1 Tax=Bacillus cereus HuA4-10 TaxID=1053206 RepID=J8DG76_BACCE|nr:hypothetical protein IGC_04607 [Bacillus cereus HuA4-10]
MMKYSKIAESIISPFKIVTKKDCFEWAFLRKDYQNAIHPFPKQKRRPYILGASSIITLVARYIILQVAA